MGILCVEMESAALYMSAARCGKNALALFTISDELYSGNSLPSEDREKGFKQMMELALDTAVAL
jgi:purine-nucleoside phosphorylase